MQAARGASLNPSDPTTRPPRRRFLALFGVVAATAYLLDLGTKLLAVRELQDRAPVPVLGEVLQLTLVRNPGAAFSTGTSYTVLLSLVAIVATVVVLVLAARVRDRVWAVGLGCLLGGVLGNLTDRLFRAPGPLRGHVIDFLQLPSWPVFNIADMCINLAAGVIIVQAVRGVSLQGDRPGSAPQEQS